VWERRLIDAMNEAGPAFVERYTRSDGTLIWRDDWPGMDGSDDAYESFHTFPLFYALGGSEEIHALARMEWDAITWQFTEYGQVYREFDAYYDWMHHGESYSYLYYLALANPYVLKDRQRAARFAAFYTGEDPEAPNYDPDLRLIRSPINGSRGPRLEMSREDWSTHRDVLRHYIAPFEDIPGVTTERAEWCDDEIFTSILDLMNARMACGDVPLNLTATSQIVHAFLYSGDEKYRRWVLDYLAAWEERTTANFGIMPDNVGLNGHIGEYMDGKWWGGYYGWRWPHGAMNLLESSVIAGMNAALLTGDTGRLELARSQIDLLWSLRREEEGESRVPHRHMDAGWSDYRPMSPALPIQLWSLSEADEDLERILRLPGQERWEADLAVRGGGWAPGAAWLRWMRGGFPGFPEAALAASYAEVLRQMEQIRSDRTPPQEMYIQHWIDRLPVICATLVELTTGAPSPIYHGGLLHCRVRWFDPERRRPGLPDQVAALVEGLRPGGFTLRLCNLDTVQPHRLIAQAGAFGEHSFVSVLPDGAADRIPIGARRFEIALPPGALVSLDVETLRFANTPCYETPWGPGDADVRPIGLRQPEVDPGALLFFPDWE
jgi:hypothetical protein